MEIYDLDKIQIDPKTNLYDLTQLTHQHTPFPTLIPYTVKNGEEMRIDLVCKSIYNTTNNIDVLLYCNFIDNPLNILEGSVIYYPVEKDIDKFRYEEQQAQNKLDQLVNTSKLSKIDPNRQKYVDEDYSLPPTTLPSPTDQVKIDGNSLLIGSGLF